MYQESQPAPKNNCDPMEADHAEVTQVKHAVSFHGRMYDSGLCGFIRMSHFFLCVISGSCLLRKLNWQPFIIIEERSSALFEVEEMHAIQHQAWHETAKNKRTSVLFLL